MLSANVQATADFKHCSLTCWIWKKNFVPWTEEYWCIDIGLTIRVFMAFWWKSNVCFSINVIFYLKKSRTLDVNNQQVILWYQKSIVPLYQELLILSPFSAVIASFFPVEYVNKTIKVFRLSKDWNIFIYN